VRKLAAATLLGVDASQPGRLEQARKGTLFLGDIEDLPESTQRLLSGLLESGRYVRTGGGDPRRSRPASSPRRGPAS
jgi:transcriptional regulator with AAA-type ATPase domain